MGKSDGSYRSVLSLRDFRLLVVGSATSQIGDWLYNVALLVFVYQATHSAGWVGAATMARLVPYVLLAPLGGVVADRYERTRVLVLSDLTRAAFMTVIAVVVALSGPAPLVMLLAAASTCAGVAARPAALATMPAMVGESGLAPANALLHTVQDVGVVSGPALGALILAVSSPSVAFGVNAATFLVSAAAIAAIRTRSRGQREVGAAPPSAMALFVDGLRAVRTTPYVPVLTLITFLGAFTYGAQTVQLVLYAQQRLGLSADGYGYLLAASGAGGVLGAAFSNRMASRSRIALPLVGASVAFVGSQLLWAGTSLVAVALAIGVLAGLGMVVSDVVSETAISRAASNDVMGRIFGAYDGISVGAMVLGALVAAPIVHGLGLRGSMVVLGTIVVVGTLLCLPVLRRLDAVSAHVVDALAPRLEVLGRLAIFNGAPRRALEQLAESAREVDVAPGTAVVAQGEPADAFYAVIDGSLEVSSAGESGGAATFLRELGAGSYFGEIGLLERIPRTATVRAVTPCRLLRLEGADFLDALTSAPAGVLALSDGVVRGLARTHPSIEPARTAELRAEVSGAETPAL